MFRRKRGLGCGEICGIVKLAVLVSIRKKKEKKTPFVKACMKVVRRNVFLAVDKNFKYWVFKKAEK